MKQRKWENAKSRKQMKVKKTKDDLKHRKERKHVHNRRKKKERKWGNAVSGKQMKNKKKKIEKCRMRIYE